MYKLGAAYGASSRTYLDVICEGKTFGMLAYVEYSVSFYGTSNIYEWLLFYAFMKHVNCDIFL